MKKTLVCLLVAAVLVVPALLAQKGKQDARAAIDAAGKTFSAAVAAGDTAKVAALYAEDALAGLRESGIFALSEPGKLDGILAAVRLTPRDDDEVECPVTFDDIDAAERAFMGAGPMQLAIATSGASAVAAAVRAGLEPFIQPNRSVVLDGSFRAVIATG